MELSSKMLKMLMVLHRRTIFFFQSIMPITIASSGGLFRQVLLTQLVITQANNHHWKSTQINVKILMTLPKLGCFGKMSLYWKWKLSLQRVGASFVYQICTLWSYHYDNLGFVTYSGV